MIVYYSSLFHNFYRSTVIPTIVENFFWYTSNNYASSQYPKKQDFKSIQGSAMPSAIEKSSVFLLHTNGAKR